MNHFSRVLGQLSMTYPPFAARYAELITRCHDRGADYVVLCLHRTYAQQSALYAQGRTTRGTIVTNARAGRSAHNFGAAADCVRDIGSRPGVQPSWQPKDYAILGEEAEKLGLEWSGRWTFKEYGHVQWPGINDSARMKQLDIAMRIGGLAAVWAILDRWQQPEGVA